MRNLLLSYAQISYLCSDYTAAQFRRIVIRVSESSDLPRDHGSARFQVASLPSGLFELSVSDDRASLSDQLEVRVCLENGKCSAMQRSVLPNFLKLLKSKLLAQDGSFCTNDLTRFSSSVVNEVLSGLQGEVDFEPYDPSSEPFPLSEPDWIQISRARLLLNPRTDSLHDRQVDASRGKTDSRMPQQIPFSKVKTQTPTKPNVEVLMSNTHTRSSGFFAPPPKLSPARLANLKKHVVNLNRGKFSGGGKFTSSKQSMQAIFDRHIPEWMADQRDSAHLDLVLYSHGGLTNEAWGLAAADKQVDWWKANGVYPIFFVWETGLMETLWQMFQRWWTDAPRGWFDGVKEALAEVNDGFWEGVFRTGQGPTVWGGMKASARLAFDEETEGDGVTFLESLVEFINGFERDVRLHAVGHSAGSIFLSRAIAAANRIWEEYPKFETVHFLAPAITTQLFRQTLMPLIGRSESDQAKHLSVFTMSDGYEKDDKVGPYGKSLLYLIHQALEPEKETHLVGLEHSLNSESDMSDFFGLTGPTSQLTDVVYSVTPQSGSKKNRSESVTHGGFDDDPATMESVCRRIIDSEDDAGFTSFPKAKGLDPTQLPRSFPTLDSRNWSRSCQGLKTKPGATPSPSGVNRGKGSRTALCIGINDYDVKPLSGCENDARRWKAFFESIGFSVELLLSAQATRANIVGTIAKLFENAQRGDVIAIQFAGHGTQVPDEDRGDEYGGDSPRQDEALVPIDYRTDGLLLDDDVGELCRGIPDGVSVTFFFDNCNSGTATRMFMNSKSSNGTSRFLPPTQEMIALNREARNRRGMSRSSFSNPYEGGREILFAACSSREPAWESGGSGDFTRHAMSVFDRHGSDLTCDQFMDLVLQEFGVSRRQTPGLWCDPDLESTPLLGGGAGMDASNSATGSSPAERELGNLVAELQRVIDRFSN